MIDNDWQSATIVDVPGGPKNHSDSEGAEGDGVLRWSTGELQP